MVEAQCQRFEVRSADGETVLFSADEEEISIGTEKLRVTGKHAQQVTLRGNEELTKREVNFFRVYENLSSLAVGETWQCLSNCQTQFFLFSNSNRR